MVADPKARAMVLEHLVASAFLAAGWRVERQPRLGDLRPDLLVKRGKRAYVVEVKYASEARRDRVIPLLAQAILQAQAAARHIPRAVPLAVIGAAAMPAGLVDEVRRFVKDLVPKVAVGIVGLDGYRAFNWPDLEWLDAEPKPSPRVPALRSEPRSNLFSDLNQWMLKVLLAPRIPDPLLSAPRGEYRNPSQLASAANVSIMSAFRLARLLVAEGHLDEAGGPLRIVRLEELVQRWRAANHRVAHEWPMRWILRGDPKRQLEKALSSYASSAVRGRACLGLFAAADALGLGFVHGVKPHLYLDQVRADPLRRLGLIHAASGDPVDVLVRVPAARESVFRGAVLRQGMRVADVLQVWMDVSMHPSRGRAQAEEIERRVLGSLLGRKR